MKKVVSLLIAFVMIASVVFTTPVVAYTDTIVNSISNNEENTSEESGFMALIHAIFFSKLSFDSNGGSEIPDQYALKLFGKFKTPSEPTKEGYTFAGWEPEIPSHAPLFGNINVKAKWDANTYSIKWIVDGIVVNESTYKFNQAIDYYYPEKEGYTFLGWKDFPTLMPAEDINLYAEFSINSYTVSWVVDNDREVVSYNYGETINTVANPIKEGYTFKGWDGETFDTMPAHDVEYTAKFNVNSYKSTFTTEKGSFPAGDKTVEILTDFGEVVHQPDSPIREGYIFGGWDTLVPETMPAKDLSFNATWISRDDTPYTVETYVMDINGNYPEPQINTYEGTSDTTATYSKGLKGFHIDKSISTLSTNINPDGSGLLKVYYARNEYTVTFVVNNSIDEDVVQKYLYGQTLVSPEGLKRGGHAFAGWSPKLPAKVTSNATYTAMWESTVTIVETVDSVAYANQLKTLIEDQMSNASFDIEEAENDAYYSSRLIAGCKSYDSIDYSETDAEIVITNPEGIVVLQYNDEKLAKNDEEQIKSIDDVLFVEPDMLASTYDSADLTWGKPYISADAYEHYLEFNNFFDMVTVAVVDSGVDLDHSYLANRLSSGGYDFVDCDEEPDDDYGHGTHVAGIIASCTAGLNIKILPMKVMMSNGKGYNSIIAQGILQAANMNADVINLSLGCNKSALLDKAVNDAIIIKGAVVCVAAGNDHIDTAKVSPANVEAAIVVGSIANDNSIAPYSNYGSSVDVVAPGENISSTYLDGSYAIMRGTSMATPHVAAAAAMFKLAVPTSTPAQIEAKIKNYCIDLGSTGRDDIFGYGVLNMYNAIPDCTVSFNTNGGSASNSKTVKSTEDIVLPKPTKSYKITLNANGGSVGTTVYYRDCTLEGWYKSSSLTGTRYAPNAAYMTHKDETLYAKWTDPDRDAINDPVSREPQFEFLGWYSEASGGTKYDSLKKITGNITLYAHWRARTKVYGDWSSEITTTGTPPSNHDNVEVQIVSQTTVTTYTYYHYCCNWYDNKNNVDSIVYGSGKHYYHEITRSSPLPAFNMPDKGGKQAYGGSGSGAPICMKNGWYAWFLKSTSTITTTVYKTRNFYWQ